MNLFLIAWVLGIVLGCIWLLRLRRKRHPLFAPPATSTFEWMLLIAGVSIAIFFNLTQSEFGVLTGVVVFVAMFFTDEHPTIGAGLICFAVSIVLLAIVYAIAGFKPALLQSWIIDGDDPPTLAVLCVRPWVIRDTHRYF